MTRITEGPLTVRQKKILEAVSLGHSHDKIARDLTREAQAEEPSARPVTRPVVSMDLRNIRKKLACANSAQAAARFATRRAYLAAAELLELGKPPYPAPGSVDEHVCHVLDGLADVLRERAAQLLP